MFRNKKSGRFFSCRRGYHRRDHPQKLSIEFAEKLEKNEIINCLVKKIVISENNHFRPHHQTCFK